MSMELYGQAPSSERGRELWHHASRWDVLRAYWREVAPTIEVTPGDGVNAWEVMSEENATELARLLRDGVRTGGAEEFLVAWDERHAAPEQSESACWMCGGAGKLGPTGGSGWSSSQPDVLGDLREPEGWFSESVEEFAGFLEGSGGVDFV